MESLLTEGTPCEASLTYPEGPYSEEVPIIDIDASETHSSITNWADALTAYSGLTPSDDFIFRFWPGTYTSVNIDSADFTWLPANSLTFMAATSPDSGSPVVLVGTTNDPVFNFHGVSTITQVLRIGYALGEDRADWRGFQIKGGEWQLQGGFPPVFEGGAGIRLFNNTMAIEVVGNIVGADSNGNFSAGHGGGIGANRCPEGVLIALNEVCHNEAGQSSPTLYPEILGAGIAIDYYTSAKIIKNKIHENHFDDRNPDNQRTRSGGGIGVNASYGLSSTGQDVAICSNEIHDNNAVLGAGICVNTFGLTDSNYPTVYIRENEIYENTPWFHLQTLSDGVTPGYRGGGLYIENQPQQGSYNATVDVLNNEIHSHDYRIALLPSGFYTGSTPTLAGAGMFIVGRLRDASDTVSRLWIEGNVTRNNTGEDTGAGAFFDLVDVSGSPGSTAAEAKVHNNSFVGNELVSGTTDGSGVHFAEDAAFDASNNVIYHNTGGDGDWFAEGSLDPQTDDFRYTQTPSTVPSGSVDLYGTSGQQNDDDDPVIMSPTIDHHLFDDSSPCIDSADDAANLGLQTERDILDYHLRETDILSVTSSLVNDRGADEFVYMFRRGDFDGNGSINLADPVALLSYLLSSGPKPQECEDALDGNDDGSLDIADPSYLLSYLFSGGPPPPPPFSASFGSCGWDPTIDGLPECNGPNGGMCP